MISQQDHIITNNSNIFQSDQQLENQQQTKPFFFLNTLSQPPHKKVEKRSFTQQISINILKHIPKPLSVLDKQPYQPISPRCLYQMPLSSASQNMANYVLQKAANTKLFGVQEHQYDLKKIKNKITKIFKKNNKDSINKENQESQQQNQIKYYRLGDIYSSMQSHYARFLNNHNKKSFANLLMSVNGVNIFENKKSSLMKKCQIPKLLTPASQNQNLKGSVRFDSHFQCGNLLYVYKRENSIDNPQQNSIQTYDLILQNDINTKGHNQWFYFKVQNNSIKNLKIKMNIVNFIKKDSLFNNGMRILTFSQKRFQKSGKGWMRQGERLSYDENEIKRQNKEGFHYTLSFEYTFKNQNDTIYFCPSYPYSYSQLTKYLQEKFKKGQFNKVMSIKSISQTVGGNPINVLTISSGRITQIGDDQFGKNMKIIWILARQHPCETTGSFMIEGIIDYLGQLMNKTRKSQNQTNWLDFYIFKIVPMVNIDGVIHGNTRSQLTGVDPNRMWNKPYKRLTPTINAIKKAILQNKSNVDLILDLHSHSRKTGCFFYGNTVVHNPKLTKVYPTFVCENDQRFEIKNCRFRGGYDTTLRRVLFNQLPNPNIYTIECSLYGYNKNYRTIEYSIEDLKQMGKKLILSYIQLEQQKISKKLQQIILQHNITYDAKDECQSARSDSSLSDEEFQEIYKKGTKKKHNKFFISKKQKKTKVFTGNNAVSESSKNRVKQISTVQQKTRSLLKQINGKLQQRNKSKRFSEEKSLLKKQLPSCKKQSFRQSNFSMMKQIEQQKSKIKLSIPKNDNNQRLKRNKYLKNHILKQVSAQHKSIQNNSQPKATKNNKNSLSQAVQVQITIDTRDHLFKNANSQNQLKQKSIQNLCSQKRKDNNLCVVGSAIQDERQVFVCGKNEISVQTFIFNQDNEKSVEMVPSSFGLNKSNVYQIALQGSSQIKESKSTKIPKILNYICNNVLGKIKQNSLLPTDKKPIVQQTLKGQNYRPKSNPKNPRVNVSFRH